MPLDLNTALNSYGFVGQMANAIPDLKDILGQAIAGEWVPEQFTRAVMDSGWWKNNAESARQLVRLQTTDPATYQQNLRNAAEKAQLMAWELGVEVDVNGMGLQALLNNWDDQQIRIHLAEQGKYGGWGGVGDFSGQAAQVSAHLREVAQNYGQPFTDQNISAYVRHIQAGRDSLEGFENVMKARAKATYAHLAGQIDAGMTVRDIADPYIATMAQTLELPETGINWVQDPAIQKALQVRNPDGTAASKPMWQFQRELKDDARWDSTKNAQDEAYRFTARLGKDMGFLS